jgi:hypothetical protein
MSSLTKPIKQQQPNLTKVNYMCGWVWHGMACIYMNERLEKMMNLALT